MTRLTQKISKFGKIMVSGEFAQEWCKMPRHLFSDAHDLTKSKNFKVRKIMVSGEFAQEWCKMPRHLFSDAHDLTKSKNFKVRKNHGFWGVCPGMVQNASPSI